MLLNQNLSFLLFVLRFFVCHMCLIISSKNFLWYLNEKKKHVWFLLLFLCCIFMFLHEILIYKIYIYMETFREILLVLLNERKTFSILLSLWLTDAMRIQIVSSNLPLLGFIICSSKHFEALAAQAFFKINISHLN